MTIRKLYSAFLKANRTHVRAAERLRSLGGYGAATSVKDRKPGWREAWDAEIAARRRVSEAGGAHARALTSQQPAL
jgi:hypothetical protein